MMRTAGWTIALAFMLALALAWTTTSTAQHNRPIDSDPETAFKEADRNESGGIDHAEYQQRMVEVFYFADVNRDGLLVGTEIDHTGRANPAAGDKNGDGQVTMQEFIDEAFDRFDAADVDDDEELSIDEVRVAYAQ